MVVGGICLIFFPSTLDHTIYAVLYFSFLFDSLTCVDFNMGILESWEMGLVLCQADM